MAVAGRFGLDIYVISLLDQSLGDSELVGLFNTLPPRCLLLLEDIDSVGLARRPDSDYGRGKLAALKTDDDESEDEDKKGQRSRVSLSGLLNAVDGVAAPEGHILIMTTNKPDALDEALVRSGRISVRIKFAAATKSQARDLFVRMLKNDGADDDDDNGELGEKASDGKTSEEDLAILAEKFAEQIPEHEFSPADLQDFLLTRKTEPQRAVDEVETWKVEILKERAIKAEERERWTKERAEKAKAVKERQLSQLMAGAGVVAPQP